jgi:hypothetical protein
MTCEEFEYQLSDYMERSPGATTRAEAEAHLTTCVVCRGLLDDVGQLMDVCRDFPEVEPDAALVPSILQRTTGVTTRTQPWLAKFKSLFHPILFPKFAIGAMVAACFVSFAIHFLSPRMAGSSSGMVRKADVFVHQLYGRGLKVYDKIAQWQADLKSLTAGLVTKIDYHIGQIGEHLKPEPKEEQKQKDQPEDKKEKKSSIEPSIFAQCQRPVTTPGRRALTPYGQVFELRVNRQPETRDSKLETNLGKGEEDHEMLISSRG